MEELNLAAIDDIDDIMLVINDAKTYLKNQGSTQWNLPDGYPNKSDLIKDINNKECYVYKLNQSIIGVLVIMENIDENYNEIDGNWLNNDNYVSIHRIALKLNFHNQKIGIKKQV